MLRLSEMVPGMIDTDNGETYHHIDAVGVVFRVVMFKRITIMFQICWATVECAFINIVSIDRDQGSVRFEIFHDNKCAFHIVTLFQIASLHPRDCRSWQCKLLWSNEMYSLASRARSKEKLIDWLIDWNCWRHSWIDRPNLFSSINVLFL